MSRELMYDSKTRMGIIACLLASFISTYSLMMVSVSLKDVQNSLGVSYNEALWFTWSPIIATLGLCFISSALANRFGKKRILVIGLVLTVITSALSFFSNDYAIVLILRVVQGGAMSFLYITMVSIMTDLAFPEDNKRVMGYNNIFSQLGTVIAALGGYLITNQLGWHYIGLVLIPVSLAAIYLVKDIPNVTNPEYKTSFVDQILFTVVIVLFFFGMGMSAEYHGDKVILVSLIVLAVFLFRQRRRENWVFDYRLFVDNPVFRLSAISAVAMYIVVYNTGQLAGCLMQAMEEPLAREAAVVATMLGPAVQIVVTWFFAEKIKRISEAHKLWIGFITAFIASLMLALIPFADDISDIVICMVSLVFISIAGGLFTPSNTSLMMTSVSEVNRNDASSVNNFLRQFNKINGSLLVVILMDGVAKSMTSTVFKHAFGILAILYIAALIVAMYMMHSYFKKKSQSALLI